MHLFQDDELQLGILDLLLRCIRAPRIFRAMSILAVDTVLAQVQQDICTVIRIRLATYPWYRGSLNILVLRHQS